MTRHAADPGSTLADRLAHPAPMTPLEVATIGHQVATELDAWHRDGHVHRALDPAAVVVLAADGVVRARLRPPTDGVAAGSRYHAPEQLTGRPVGPAADVYALGVVLLDSLVGPRDHVAHVPDDLGAAWRYLLTGMVASSAADRPTAGTVAHTLGQVPGVLPAPAPTTAAAGPPVDAGPRSKLLPGGAHVTPTSVDLPRENRLTRLLPPVPGRRRPREPDVRHQPGDQT